jgi:hypothetical protein
MKEDGQAAGLKGTRIRHSLLFDYPLNVQPVSGLSRLETFANAAEGVKK